MPSSTLGFGPITDLQSRLRALQADRPWSWPVQLVAGGAVVGLAFGCTGVDKPEAAKSQAAPKAADEGKAAVAEAPNTDEDARPANAADDGCATAREDAVVLSAWLETARGDATAAVATAAAEVDAAGEDGLAVAKARAKRGHAHAVAGDFAAAVRDFQEAAWQSASNKDGVGAASSAAYTMLAEERQGDPEAARAWAKHVAAALRRLEGAGPIAVEPAFYEAMIRLNPDEADAHRKSLEAHRAACGELPAPIWATRTPAPDPS